jgi:hypothetical protein
MTSRQESSPTIGTGEFTAVHPDDGTKQSQFQGAGNRRDGLSNKANCAASILPRSEGETPSTQALSRQTKPIRRRPGMKLTAAAKRTYENSMRMVDLRKQSQSARRDYFRRFRKDGLVALPAIPGTDRGVPCQTKPISGGQMHAARAVGYGIQGLGRLSRGLL